MSPGPGRPAGARRCVHCGRWLSEEPLAEAAIDASVLLARAGHTQESEARLRLLRAADRALVRAARELELASDRLSMQLSPAERQAVLPRPPEWEPKPVTAVPPPEAFRALVHGEPSVTRDAQRRPPRDPAAARRFLVPPIAELHALGVAIRAALSPPASYRRRR